MTETVSQDKPGWVPHLEKLVDRALALDEETVEALAELSGKVIGFHFVNTELTLYLLPTANGLKINTAFAGKPDIMIKGTPINFVSMMASTGGKTGSMPADMELIGDIGLAQRFQHIMQNIEIDLEEPLSSWVGDTAAFQIGQLIRKTHRFAVNTGKTLAMDISEYLRFEKEMLPDDLLVKEFCEDVDTLRDDVDRLAQRITMLEAKINNRKKT